MYVVLDRDITIDGKRRVKGEIVFASNKLPENSIKRRLGKKAKRVKRTIK